MGRSSARANLFEVWTRLKAADLSDDLRKNRRLQGVDLNL